MKKIPKAVDIFGHQYKIRIVPNHNEELSGKYLGRVVYVDKDIFINGSAPLEAQQETLLHEMVHAILYRGGMNDVLDSKQLEGVCNAVANGLCRFVFGGK